MTQAHYFPTSKPGTFPADTIFLIERKLTANYFDYWVNVSGIFLSNNINNVAVNVRHLFLLIFDVLQYMKSVLGFGLFVGRKKHFYEHF